MIFDVLYLSLLILFLLAGLWSVLTFDLLKAAIGLALVSAVLALLLFHMHAPLAGVFELSVCSGLITVVFISVISLTKPLEGADALAHDRSRMKRFIFLPILAVIVGGILYALRPHIDLPLPPAGTTTDVRQVFWNVRRLDLAGQILAILAGIFGVVILFKERPAAKGETKS